MIKDSVAEFLKPVLAWLQAQAGSGEHMRALIMAGAGLVFVALLLIANNTLGSAQQSLRRAQSDLANLSRQLSEGSWEERRRQSDELRLNLVDRFWVAETAGLAEATLERWLRERAEKYGVKPDSVRIQRSNAVSGGDDQASAAMKGVQRMTAKMTLPFEPQALMQLLQDAARNDKMLIVDRLFIRSGRNSLVEIDVSTFIRLDEPVVQR
ncbi:MAG: hypothetical protein JNM81_08480 [Rhodospirillaceae bacterium]|nr:hypothetical protein [Rhodospirillaceae bacterium]